MTKANKKHPDCSNCTHPTGCGIEIQRTWRGETSEWCELSSPPRKEIVAILESFDNKVTSPIIVSIKNGPTTISWRLKG